MMNHPFGRKHQVSARIGGALCFLIGVSLLILLAGFSNPALASPSPPPPLQVTALEQALFTITYERDDLPTRLGRLEQSTFGQPSPQLPPEERIRRLSSIILKPMPQKANDASMPALEEHAATASAKTADKPAEKIAVTQVAELEKYLLNQTHAKETMIKRVERLERQVFNRTQNGSIASRIDRLNQRIMGNPNDDPNPQAAQAPAYTPPSGPIAYNDPNSYNTPAQADPYQDPYADPGDMNSPYQAPPMQYPVYPVYNPNRTVAPTYVNNSPATTTMPQAAPANTNATVVLDQMEREVFKQTYPGQSTPARLDRLEAKIFGSTAPELSDSERIDRLMAVVAADGDNPKTAARGGVKGSGWQALLPFVIMIPLMFL